MKVWLLTLVIMSAFLSACDSFNAGTQFSSGRQAFLAKKYDEALPYFKKVSESKPDFTFDSMNFRQSIWSYLGRTQYLTGKLAEARQSLERALVVKRDEHLARVFFGLVLVRDGDHGNGFPELAGGLKGLQEWIEYENAHNASHTAWDPRREIRGEISKTLAAIEGKNYEPRTVIENGEWIGTAMEEEIDKVRRDKTRQTD